MSGEEVYQLTAVEDLKEMDMNAFLDAQIKEEGIDVGLEEGEDVAEVFARLTDCRLGEAKFKDGILTAADWDILAKRMPECSALEIHNTDMQTIEPISSTNPIAEKIGIIVLSVNKRLKSLDFVKSFPALHTLCIDAIPEISKKEDILVAVNHPSMKVIELANTMEEDEDGDNIPGTPIFGFETLEDFRKWCFETNPKLEVVNNTLESGEFVSPAGDSEEEEEEEFDYEGLDLENLSEEQMNALIEGGQLDMPSDSDEEEDDDEEDVEEEGEGEEEEEETGEPDAKRAKTE